MDHLTQRSQWISKYPMCVCVHLYRQLGVIILHNPCHEGCSSYIVMYSSLSSGKQNSAGTHVHNPTPGHSSLMRSHPEQGMATLNGNPNIMYKLIPSDHHV